MDAVAARFFESAMSRSRALFSALALLTVAATAALAAVEYDSTWTAPQAPIRIHGNTYSVGPQGLGVFLITAPTGHVLIDGGVPGGAPLIEANIRKLGFELRDIKWILNTHAHFDHAGDIAQLALDTGAEVIASAAATALLARGGVGDPQYGDRFPFPAVQATRTVRDGERLQLGDLTITAHATPGHTKGNTTWAWESCEGGRCLRIADIGSLSAPSYVLVGRADSEALVTDYESSFAKLAALPCDIALAPHPGMVDFWERVASRDKGKADALVDPKLCRSYVKAAQKNFRAQLARQRKAARR